MHAVSVVFSRFFEFLHAKKNKTDPQDITYILLKMALKLQNQQPALEKWKDNMQVNVELTFPTLGHYFRLSLTRIPIVDRFHYASQFFPIYRNSMFTLWYDDLITISLHCHSNTIHFLFYL